MQNREIVGGKWWKVDFHLHTPGSYDYGHGDAQQAATSPEDFLKCCMEKKLDCIVVADHDCFKWVPKLRDALNFLQNDPPEWYRKITIFPGIEVNSQGNVHLLGIFDPSTPFEDLIKISARMDINDKTQTTDKSPNEVMDVIIKHGGIAIPAHVDGPSGLFLAPASTIKSVLQVQGLLALELLKNSIEHALYKESKLNLACVLGSDSHSTDTIGEKYTWVKMGEPNIEALRLALYDSKDGAIRSIDCYSDPNNIAGRTYIEELTIKNGKCIGRKEPYKIQFSPWLNCLIGGRGAGKSTILKFLRLVLNRQSELPSQLMSDFAEFAQIPQNRKALGLLLNDTTVTLRMIVEGVPHKLVWHNNVIYEEVNGQLNAASSITDRFPVKIFSQKQLYEMTKNTHLLFEFMDLQWDSKDWEKRMNAACENFKLCRKRISTLYKSLQEKQQIETKLRDLEGKLRVFENPSTASVLNNAETLNKHLQIVKCVYKSKESLINLVRQAKTLESSPVPDFSTLDEDSKCELQQWISSIEQMKKDFVCVFEKYEADIITYDTLLSKLHLCKMISANRQEMNEVLQQLRDAGVDGVERYSELLEEKRNVVGQLQSYEGINQRLQEERCKQDMYLDEIDKLTLERHANRCKVIDAWNSLGYLRLKLHLFQDIEENEYTFRKIIRKDTGFDSDILSRDSDTAEPLSGFIQRISCIPQNLSKHEQISALRSEKEALLHASSTYSKRFISYLSKLCEQYEYFEDELLTWIPDDKLTLEIKTGNRFSPVDAGSPGQRTSAILSLILSISDAPIIIDQPEDDLDTRNITEIVVKGINRIKPQQQIIVVTHNPNIVVNTNSEQVIYLDYRNGQIVSTCAGALQNHDVRDAICEVMEGGKDALEQRYYRIFKALSTD